MTEVNPDKRPALSAMGVMHHGRDLVWVLEVPGLGALTMRGEGDEKTGRLRFKGVALFTTEEIQHGPA